MPPRISSAPHRRIDRDNHIGVVIGWTLVEALMWSVIVEMALVPAEHHTSVALVVDQHPIRALGPDAADEPLGITVRPRRSRWGLDDLDVLGHEHGVERAGELGVSVPDQKPEGADPIAEIQDEIAGLLGGPCLLVPIFAALPRAGSGNWSGGS
jgi:hypothetical protein